MTPGRGANKGAKHKPPSRIRYEESHPVVSFRVKEDLYQQLVELLAKSGKSIGDFFKEALGVQRADTRKIYRRGYEKGYDEAGKLYRVTYRCSVCRGILEVTHTEEKEAVRQYLEEHSWGHASCHQKRSGGAH
jgi:hypothetical protein